MTARKNPAHRGTILVVDDESGIRDVFTEIISDLGYRVVAAANSEQAHKIVLDEHIKMAFIDIWMPPGIDGIDLLKRWKEQGLLTFPVAIISGYADVQTAVKAMNCGAEDVLTKPVERKQIEALLHKVAERSDGELFQNSIKELVMGKSPALVKVKGGLLKATATLAPITLIGPPAVGREYFAMLTHAVGKPWVWIHDPRTLESHPTGRLAEARFGTIYVRNLEQLNANQQRGLYQLLRNTPDQRTQVVCESCVALADLAAAGQLSAELAAKLKLGEIVIPPLEDYVNDLPVLLSTLVQRLVVLDGTPSARFSEDALRLLTNDSERWGTGGLGALVGIVQVLLRLAVAGEVGVSQVSKLLHVNELAANSDDEYYKIPLREARKRFEQQYFTKLMESTSNNFQEAARIAGLDRTYLYRKVEALYSSAADSKDN